MKNKQMKWLALLSFLPIEYIALLVDYNTSTMWGYIPFTLLIVLTVTFFKRIDRLIFLLVIRLLGSILSYISIQLSSQAFIESNYFKPLTTIYFSIMLSVVSIIFIVSVIIYKKIVIKRRN